MILTTPEEKAAWERLCAKAGISTKPISRKRSKPRRGPVKDPAYLEWITQQQCCACREWPSSFRPTSQSTPTEAAHCGTRGLGQKCSDREALPLCERHHRTGPLAHHKLGKKFWSYHGLNREKLIAEYNHRFEASIGGRVISV